MAIYVVREEDSVDAIAESADVPVEELLWANQIEYPYRLAVRQEKAFLPLSGHL